MMKRAPCYDWTRLDRPNPFRWIVGVARAVRESRTNELAEERAARWRAERADMRPINDTVGAWP